MKKWITISLTLVACGAFAGALSPWWLPLFGLAGPGNEMIRPLKDLWPWLVWVLIGALALLLVNLRWDRIFRRAQSRRLVDEAEDWSDDFRIGSDVPLELANQEPEHEPESHKAKVRFFAEQLEPLERQESLPIAAAERAATPVFASEPEPPLDPGPAPLAATHPESLHSPEPQAEPVAAPEPAPLRPKKYRERVTVAFADEPEAEVVELPPTGELLSPLAPAGDDGAGDKLTSSDIANAATIAQAEQLPATYFQLPPLPEFFTGRATELAALSAAADDPAFTSLGIQGPGGVGKTALALALAHQLAPRFPDAQFYLDLRGTSTRPLTIADIQAHILRVYQPDLRLPESAAALQQAYETALTGKQALLLLDNAANLAQVNQLPPPPGCLLILTTRANFSLPGMFPYPLEQFPEAEAAALLLRLVPRIGEHAAQIARQCGSLPLALHLAASSLAQRPELTAASYSWKLAQVTQRMTTAGQGHAYEPALTLSYELLSAGLQKLWRTLAVFPDTFDVTGAAAVWTLHPERALRALRRLMEFELVEGNLATGRYRLHDLKQAFANTLLRDAERRVCLQNHAEYYQSVLHEADALYEQSGAALKRGLGLVDRDWHNIEAGQAWAAINAEVDLAACELCSSYPDAGRYVLDLRQPPRERLRWCEAALAAASRLNRRKAESRHLLALGQAHWQLNEIEQAQQHYEGALAIAREQADHGGTARALNGLGRVYYARKAFDEARAQHAQALESARANGDQRSEAQALGGLGLIQAGLGEWQAAHELFQQQLTLTRATGDQRGEASALTQLGSCRAALKAFDEALELHEQALTLAREMGDRRGEAAALGGLGLARLGQGETAQAAAYFAEQLRVARDAGDQRNETLANENLRAANLAEPPAAPASAAHDHSS
jgi:tetratricopeptide (TPR) repeat protein